MTVPLMPHSLQNPEAVWIQIRLSVNLHLEFINGATETWTSCRHAEKHTEQIEQKGPRGEYFLIIFCFKSTQAENVCTKSAVFPHTNFVLNIQLHFIPRCPCYSVIIHLLINYMDIKMSASKEIDKRDFMSIESTLNVSEVFKTFKFLENKMSKFG